MLASLKRFARTFYRPTLVTALVATLVVPTPSLLLAGEKIAPEKTLMLYPRTEPIAVENSTAKTQDEMKPYTDIISGPNVKFDMLPVRGGSFLMGSSDKEPGHQPDEAPQHVVEVDPFWMGKCEVTWDEYEVFQAALDIHRRKTTGEKANAQDAIADTVTRPTQPYTDMTFGMGKQGYPAICMTHLAARMYCKWLTAKTGRFYRLPTEAEWEYACRAGTKTAYSFGDDPAQMGDYAWTLDNSNDSTHPVGKKKPNPWGLHDMHGNVSEWVLDEYEPKFYAQFLGKVAKNPLALPKGMYPQVVRGGSWEDEAPLARSAARRGSSKDWKEQDPQIPQSIWYFTDALFVGFRVVRPLHEPSKEEQEKIWNVGLGARE